MKNYKNTAITFGIIAGVLLIAGVIITYKWMQLRKSVAKVATNTANPTPSAVAASVDAVHSQAANVTA